MKHWSSASPVLLVLFLATRAAAQPAPGQTPQPAPTPAPAPPAAQPEPAPAPQPAPEPAAPEPAPAPSPEPTVEPSPPAAAAQPPAPPPPAESTKAGPAPGPTPVLGKWSTTLYGFAEFDIQHDSTQSFTDSPGNNLIVRPDGATVLAYRNGRTTTTARNSRLGVKVSSPEWHGMKSSGNVEMDFMGNQPPGISEASFINNGAFRVRAAYAKIESAHIDMLAGQYYDIFGHQPFFFPMSISFFGLPNMGFARTQQFRLSHVFKSDAANFEMAVGAHRPPQRDSEIPDFQAGLKLGFNGWKGAHTIGSGYAAVDAISIGVSGALRHFRVNEFDAAPDSTNKETGWGVSIDALIPLIPAESVDKKGNSLTATGSFIIGRAISDLLGGLTGGATFPTLPPAMEGGAPIPYPANVDGGFVQYDQNGVLRTLNWRTFMVGAQYYLPPDGQLTIGGNYTNGKSDNITDGLADSALGRVMKKSEYFEAVALYDITPSVRAGVAWQQIRQTLGDNTKTKNTRFELSIYYFF